MSYTSDEMSAVQASCVVLPRPMRKNLFHHGLWNPDHPRHTKTVASDSHAGACHDYGYSRPTGVCRENLIEVVTEPLHQKNRENVNAGCIKAQSINNKTAIIQEIISSEGLDLLLVTETWHDVSESLSLRRIIPPGFSCIDAPRSVLDDDIESFSNHGGLALLHCDNICIVKRNLKVKVSTFEYLCGYTTIDNRHILLLGSISLWLVSGYT